MDRYETLLERLKACAASDALPMHMPGHKRNELAPYLKDLCAGLDITEIDGFDNLHAPEGILKEAQARAAALWGAEESFFLVNGSSGGILAGIYAAVQQGDEILLPRGAHKSVYHAIELRGLLPRFLLPPALPGTEIAASLTPEDVAAGLEAYPNVRLVLVTSPTYEGVISDIAGIARVCRRKNAILMVDEAHGAHLGLGGGFPAGAVKAGADIVVQSLHKTLPSLTQTAVLHRCSGRVPSERLRHALSVFQTSSPSYLLMASIDSCVSLLKEQPELLPRWKTALEEFDRSTAALQQIRLLLRSSLPEEVFAYDPGKLLLAANGVSGFAISQALRQQFHIELEMAAPGYALAMTGPGDAPGALRRLAEALCRLDGALNADLSRSEPLRFPKEAPELAVLPSRAVELPRRFVSPARSAGLTAAEYVWAYPPGIPLVIPGEKITPPLADALTRSAELPGALHSTWGRLPEQIAVLQGNFPPHS